MCCSPLTTQCQGSDKHGPFRLMSVLVLVVLGGTLVLALRWMHGGKDDDSDGWWLARVDLPGGRSHTAAGGFSGGTRTAFCRDGRPSLERDMRAILRTAWKYLWPQGKHRWLKRASIFLVIFAVFNVAVVFPS